MAKIVLGLGTSHTPMLLASDETLTRFLETDRIIASIHDKEGRAATYGDLLEKADPRMAGMVAPAQLVERQNRARAACQHLREVLSAAALDALIVFGDDQNESYLEDCRPAFAVYFGETIRNENKQHQTYSPSAGMVHQESRGILRAGCAAGLSGACRARGTHDRVSDGRRVRSGGLEAPARRRGRGARRSLYPPSCDGCRKAGAGRAGVHQHLLPAESATPAALLPAGAGGAPRGGELSGRCACRRYGVGWPEPFPGRRGLRSSDPQGACR